MRIFIEKAHVVLDKHKIVSHGMYQSFWNSMWLFKRDFDQIDIIFVYYFDQLEIKE